MTDGSISFSCATPKHEHRTQALACMCDAEQIAVLEAKLKALTDEISKGLTARARLETWRTAVEAACKVELR